MKRLSPLQSFYAIVVSLILSGILGIASDRPKEVISLWMILLGMYSILNPLFVYRALMEMRTKRPTEVEIEINEQMLKKIFIFTGVGGGILFIIIGIYNLI